MIECAFSLLDTQRKYTGQHRKYVIENARNICYSPLTREKINKREAFGYYGHGRRILCGKMDIQEVDIITLPDGSQAMVSNVPSNITVKFDVDEDGSVHHTQEILDTETGKIVQGLNASKVGGFSWACPGKDGGSKSVSLLTGFSGFDYVLAPGFSANRGYVLESAQRDLILESVAAVVGNDERAAQLVAGWKYNGDILTELEDAIFESRNAFFELKDKNIQLAKQIEKMRLTEKKTQDILVQERRKFEGVLEGIIESMPFFVPDPVMHDLMEGDFSRAKALFESASRVDFSQYPLPGKKMQQKTVLIENTQSEKAEYGSASYGFELIL